MNKFFCRNQAIIPDGGMVCLKKVRGDKVLPCPFKTAAQREQAAFPCSGYEKLVKCKR